MASQKQVQQSRRRFFYISTILSITLVLFILGIFGVVSLNFNKLSENFRENFQVHVLFLDDTREADIERLASEWEGREQIRQSHFTHKDEAKDELKEELGEDFVEFLGYNPLPHTVDLYLHSDYVTLEQIRDLEEELLNQNGVKEVLYNEMVVENLERNIRVAGGILLGLALLFLLITITLINSTIRLSMFSRRFLIKSMQLVGGSKNFIRKPFILKAVYHGFLAGVFTNILLGGGIYYMATEYPQYVIVPPLEHLAILGGSLIILGMLISLISSYFAVNKYLKMQLDELY